MYMAMGRALGAYASWMLERRSEALRTISAATQWLEARDKRLFISLNYGWLADAMMATGRHDEARNHAARALRRARATTGSAKRWRVARWRAPRSKPAPQPAEHYLALAMRAARAEGERATRWR